MSADIAPLKSIDACFADFAAGELGNSGHNLYVSRGGVLQRIHLSSVAGNGYVDIPFANSHDDDVRCPVSVHPDPLGRPGTRIELPTNGAFAAAAGDLTGNGYDDIVVACQYDGCSNEVHGQIYFGGERGYGQHATQQLWAPSSRDVVIGDFDGSGRPQIVFVSRGRLRVFRQQSGGFASDRFDDITLTGAVESATVADFDGDGHDDLVVRLLDGSVAVLWGSSAGLDAGNTTPVPADLLGRWDGGVDIDVAASMSVNVADQPTPEELAYWASTSELMVERVPARPRIKTVDWAGRPALCLFRPDDVVLLGSSPERKLETLAEIAVPGAFSVAVGDIRGRGTRDVVVVTRENAEPDDRDGGHLQRSWVLWGPGPGEAGGHSVDRAVPLLTRAANDVVLADLTGTGRLDVVVCQDILPDRHSYESLVFAATADGVDHKPVRLPTDSAVDVLVLRDPTRPARSIAFCNHSANTRLGHIPSPIYLGGPDGYAPERQWTVTGWAPTEMHFVDVRDVGRPDVIVVNSNENDVDVRHGSQIHEVTDAGVVAEPYTELATHHNMSMVIADVDRDGYLDLITGSWTQDHLLHFRGGPDGYGEPYAIPLKVDGVVRDQARFLSLADLDGDGWLDLVVPELGVNGAVLIYWGGPDGYHPDRATVLPAGRSVSSRVADLDGDGWLDLVIGRFRGDDPQDKYRADVTVYWGGPDGFSTARATQVPCYFPCDVGVADLDNDGHLDIVATAYMGLRTRDLDSYIFWNDGRGGFSAERSTRLFQHSACGVLALDFNEDGWIDLAVANHKRHGNHVCDSYLWWNGPDGFSEQRTQRLPTRGTHGLTHTDFGDVARRGAEEWFTSRVHEVDASAVRLEWRATVPPKTWVRAQVRSAATPDGLADAPWTGPGGEADSIRAPGDVVATQGRFVQYRLWLGATNSVATPRVSAVEVVAADSSAP